MGLADSFLNAVGLGLPPPDERIDPETAAAYAGGDPVMGSAAAGHDQADTNAAQAEIDAAEKAQGKALSAAQEAAILARHPSADASLATGPARARAVGRGFLGLLGSLGSILKWAGIVVVAVLLFGFYRRARGR